MTTPTASDSECGGPGGERGRRCGHTRTLYRSRSSCRCPLSYSWWLCILTIIIVVNDINKRAGPSCSMLPLVVVHWLVGTLML